jgi:phage terminase large subunit
LGAYFANEIERAETEGRITNVPVDPRMQTHTSWDLGMSDSTAITFWQLVGKEVRAVDYLEHSGVGMDWYAKELQKRNYTYGQHLLPSDAAVRELGTGRSRLETLRSLGITGRIVPQQAVHDGINAIRTLLPAMWFDQTKCKRLIAAMKNYRRTYDDKRKTYSDHPYHDWSSHGVDSVRYMATGNLRNVQKRDIVYPSLGIV